MNNQEPQNQSKITEEANVQNRRRFIKSAAAATPVVLTLASPSVGAALCMSQMLSGNTSGHSVNGSCVKGKPPAFWQNPANKSAWPPEISYGSYVGPGSTSLCSSYGGGTAFNDANAFSSSTTATPMRSILCSSLATNNATYTTALLNSYAVPNYILSPAQVKAMFNNTLAPPGYPNTTSGKVAFLKTTW